MILSACVQRVTEIPVQPLKEPDVQVKRQCGMLNYYVSVKKMTEDELKLEELLLRERLNIDKGCCHKLRLVMLLGLSEAEAKDLNETSLLIKEILHREQNLAPKDWQITQLLSDQNQWRQKMHVKQKSLTKQLKKERSVSFKLQKRLSETQSKLDQLKDIEKNINEKEQEISAPSTDKIAHEAK